MGDVRCERDLPHEGPDPGGDPYRRRRRPGPEPPREPPRDRPGEPPRNPHGPRFLSARKLTVHLILFCLARAFVAGTDMLGSVHTKWLVCVSVRRTETRFGKFQ